MWGLTYGWGGLNGDSPVPAGAWGDRRMREMSEMTGLPVSPGGLRVETVHYYKVDRVNDFNCRSQIRLFPPVITNWRPFPPPCPTANT